MYSNYWIETFLSHYPEDKTKKEIEFIKTLVPPANNQNILDLCCGDGRHLQYLQDAYSKVTGIDSSEFAIQKAKQKAKDNVQLKLLDMRSLSELKNKFNGIFILWQSFGYYSHEENSKILRAIYNLLHDGGSFILDIYNLEFFIEHTGKRTIKHQNEEITEESRISGDRLTVQLTYTAINQKEIFDWQLYSPSAIQDILGTIGFQEITAYTDFNLNKEPNPNEYKMQIHCKKKQ